MSVKQICDCGHDIDTHFRDLTTGQREACLGPRCDCEWYCEGREKKSTMILPPNNFDESKTAAGGGRPHLQCSCRVCLEWEYEQMRRHLGW